MRKYLNFTSKCFVYLDQCTIMSATNLAKPIEKKWEIVKYIKTFSTSRVNLAYLFVLFFSDKLKLKLFETKDIPKQHAIVLKVDTLDFKNSSSQATPNEAYSLVIPAEGNITISGSDKAGVFYGLQSLISLIKDNQLNVCTIEDWPRYLYRGMHMDVSRNFHTKEQILKLLDVMAMYKMNKFHFHLTDDEGWRLEIPGLPELTEVKLQV